MTHVNKNDNKKILMCFDAVSVVLFIMMRQRINTFMTNFFEDSLSV